MGLILIAVISIVILVLQNKIIDAIQPVAKDLRECVTRYQFVQASDVNAVGTEFGILSFSSLKGGWAIPIGILIVLSFPPVRTRSNSLALLLSHLTSILP